MIDKIRVIISLVLLGLTWQVLQMVSDVRLVPITRPLSQLPHHLGEYSLSTSFQSSAWVLEFLGVDDYIQYNYLDRSGMLVNLYAGYYQAVGVSGTYHSPKNCLPGGGWGLESVREVSLDIPSYQREEPIVSEMLIRNGEEYQVVLYWYQNRGRIIASEYWEKIYQVWDAIVKRRRDGTFVRIMAIAVNGDIEGARQRARDFAELVLPVLADYLPGAEL